MKIKRKIVEIDEGLCDGCGLCVPACAEAAIEILNGKARLVAERYCDGLGACLGECPKGALKVVEREAEEFDELEVQRRLEKRQKGEGEPSACDSSLSSKAVEATSAASCETYHEPVSFIPTENSALTHWPVQIRLVPATAPFLKGADLLVVADCCSIAYPYIHRDFLRGRVVLIGCPKFDDAALYVERFREIFEKADPKSVTVLTMEVPCCNGLPMMVKRGMDLSGKKVPMEHIVVSTRGQILKRFKIVQ